MRFPVRPLGAILAAILVVAIVFPGSHALGESYVFGSKSEVVVRTDRGGFLSFAGHRHTIRSNEISGSFEFDPEAGTASIDLTIPTSSLKVSDDDLSAEDLIQVQKNMEEEILEIAEFPEIRFRSTSVEESKPFENENFEVDFRAFQLRIGDVDEHAA